MVVTKRRKVAKILKHSIYTVKDMKLIPLFRTTGTMNNKDDEQKYICLFHQVSIDQGFYFSYSYDLTRTFQQNVCRKVSGKEEGPVYADIYAEDFFTPSAAQSQTWTQMQIREHKPWQSQMMWNYFLVKEFYSIIRRKKWVVPVVHGSIDFLNFAENANKFTLLLIARRSRHHAGTRYLRRGINMDGRVANFVEVEQLVIRSHICP